MTVFAVMMPDAQPDLVHAIQETFPDDSFEISETQWLVSSRLTAVALCARLGIVDEHDPGHRTGNAIVFATSSYYGRAPTTVWDWIRSKLEAPVNG